MAPAAPLPCRPFNPKISGGNVERWLIECESSMRDTLKSVLQRAFAAYDSTPRISWVCDWPGQVRSRCVYGGSGGGGEEARLQTIGSCWERIPADNARRLHQFRQLACTAAHKVMTRFLAPLSL